QTCALPISDVRDFSPGSNSSVFTSFSNLSTNQVVIYKANYTSPTNWSFYSSPNSGDFNVSSDDISAILPKYTPTGGSGVGIAWVQLVGSDYDIYFDADWLNSASPPPVPTLVSPANGSTTSDQTPTFDWTNSTGATGYDLQVDNNSNFSSPEINTSPTSSDYTPSGNLAYGTYYWRVRAKNANGTSNWSSVWSFTIQNPGPNVPFNPIPPSEATPGSTITVALDLGNASTQVSNLTVISFDLHFTNTAIIDYVPNSAVIGGFWSSVTPSSPTIIPDEPSGTVSVSVFAIGTGGQSGYGTVISLDFNISSSASDGQIIDWSIPVYQANNASGGTIALSPGTATTTITEGVCVWPGDTNNDGQVTILDINPIVINFGDTGPVRPGASMAWICQMCEPWNPESDTYVDCNGNGQVDIIDINAVVINFGKTHNKSNESSNSKKSGSEMLVSSNSATAPLIGTSPSYMSPGTDYWVEISLGDASNPVNDMNVISFELLYDNTDKIDYVEYELGSFMAGATTTVIPDDANGKISASAFNLTQGYNGSGVIFRFKFNVKASNPSGPIVQINNTWGAVQANRTDGSEQPINPLPFTYDILPVELTSFTANIVENQVSLRWETASEINNKGFDLFRNDELVTFIPGFGTTTETKRYMFDDENLQNGEYLYKLVQLDYDGTRNEVASVEVEVDYVPKEYLLSQNYPNPFNPSTTIEFGLPKASNVEIVIYNLTGEKVKEVVNDNLREGMYKINVDLSNYPSGLYLYRMKTNNFSDTKKMLLIK
ncbi:MAG: T9SS type A sorting domain-containing protein, partial [Melioribacteraceae bacterium]|nr:T9SS type A sorting domain-containing protein [Melioribacteraceae bacterium]